MIKTWFLSLFAKKSRDVQARDIGVYDSDNDQFKVAIKTGFDGYEDHISIETINKGDIGWRYSFFSPEKARAMARRLNMLADTLEGK